MKKRRPAYVLDSYALLAFFQDEAGAVDVEAVLERARTGQAKVYLCSVNLGEVLYIAERRKGLVEAQKLLAAVDQLPVDIVDATRSLVLAAAHLKAHYSIACADAFVAALAREVSGTVLTGDPEFEEVSPLVDVEWLTRS